MPVHQEHHGKAIQGVLSLAVILVMLIYYASPAGLVLKLRYVPISFVPVKENVEVFGL